MKESNATGRRYDREFKQNAVELVRAGRTVSRVARDLGVSMWSLGRWVQAANAGQAQSEPKTLATETDEQRELRRLRQEVEYLRQQRDRSQLAHTTAPDQFARFALGMKAPVIVPWHPLYEERTRLR